MNAPEWPISANAKVQQQIRRVRISDRLWIDGTGKAKLATGIGFFDHMLDQVARQA